MQSTFLSAWLIVLHSDVCMCMGAYVSTSVCVCVCFFSSNVRACINILYLFMCVCLHKLTGLTASPRVDENNIDSAVNL